MSSLGSCAQFDVRGGIAPMHMPAMRLVVFDCLLGKESRRSPRISRPAGFRSLSILRHSAHREAFSNNFFFWFQLVRLLSPDLLSSSYMPA